MVNLANAFATIQINILVMDVSIPNVPTIAPVMVRAIHRRAYAIAKPVPIVNLHLLGKIVPYATAKTIATSRVPATMVYVNATKVLREIRAT